jgi:hypothetical protein
VRRNSVKPTSNTIFNSRGWSVEVTGLGVIACFLIAFGSLVIDGSLRLSEYLVFVSFLLVSAGGLGWRMWKLAPGRGTKSAGPQRPGN